MSLWTDIQSSGQGRDYSSLQGMSFNQALQSGLVVPAGMVWNSENNQMEPSGNYVLAGTNTPVQYDDNTGGVVPVAYAPSSNTGGLYQAYNNGMVTTSQGGSWGPTGWTPGPTIGQTAWSPPQDTGFGGLFKDTMGGWAQGAGEFATNPATLALLGGGLGANYLMTGNALTAAGAGGAGAAGGVVPAAGAGAGGPTAFDLGTTGATGFAGSAGGDLSMYGGGFPTGADAATVAANATTPVSAGGGLLSAIAGGGGAATGLLPGLLSAATGLYGINQAGKLNQAGQSAAAMADPFAGQRAQYFAPLQRMAMGGNPLSPMAGTSVSQLQALATNPGAALSQIPGYQAGIDAVMRSMGAQGYQGSGNMMAALQQYGGQAYQNQFQNLMNQAQLGGNAWQADISNLAGLSGANFNPANAANLQFQGATSGTNLALNAAGLLGKGITAAVG